MTKVTTDIEHWLEMNEPEDQQSKDDLVGRFHGSNRMLTKSEYGDIAARQG